MSARAVATNGKHNDRDRVEVMVGMHTRSKQTFATAVLTGSRAAHEAALPVFSSTHSSLPTCRIEISPSAAR